MGPMPPSPIRMTSPFQQSDPTGETTAAVPGAERLGHLPAPGAFEHLFDAHAAFLDRIAEIVGKGEDTVPGDTGQDAAVEHRGDDGVAEGKHDIH